VDGRVKPGHDAKDLTSNLRTLGVAAILIMMIILLTASVGWGRAALPVIFGFGPWHRAFFVAPFRWVALALTHPTLATLA
jgi:hypothetical protein